MADDASWGGSSDSIGVGAVLGFGIDIKVSQMLNITTGFRFGYQFTDATTEYSTAALDALNDNKKASVVSNFSHTKAEKDKLGSNSVTLIPESIEQDTRRFYVLNNGSKIYSDFRLDGKLHRVPATPQSTLAIIDLRGAPTRSLLTFIMRLLSQGWWIGLKMPFWMGRLMDTTPARLSR